MNKAVNANIGGAFFHMDEGAYSKLMDYLDAIRRSISDPQGREEIMRDIEVRIAELFSEKLKSPSQVITQQELDEVIAVMGQPEDYAVDEEIFDDGLSGGEREHQALEQAKGDKKLYRDIDDKYIGGVASGLGHYLGIDAVWVRLMWVALFLFSSGIFPFVSGSTVLILYLLLWALVPAAKTATEKLAMRGEAVNISNIERKVREGFDSAAKKIKDADAKYGHRIKSGTQKFFDTLGSILSGLLVFFVKFIGVMIILSAAVALVSLFVSLFLTGINAFGVPDVVYYEFEEHLSLAWLAATAIFLIAGIPMFLLLALGLKILIPNLKPINTPVGLALLGLWVLSIGCVTALAIKNADEWTGDGYYIDTRERETHQVETSDEEPTGEKDETVSDEASKDGDDVEEASSAKASEGEINWDDIEW